MNQQHLPSPEIPRPRLVTMDEQRHLLVPVGQVIFPEIGIGLTSQISEHARDLASEMRDSLSTVPVITKSGAMLRPGTAEHQREISRLAFGVVAEDLRQGNFSIDANPDNPTIR